MRTGTAAGDTLRAHALWFAAPGVAELRPEPVPPPGPGEVRVRSMASAISHGTEMLVYRGEVPADLPLDLPTLKGGYGFPIKYGYATVGRVIDAGPDADLHPGETVFVHHPHQDVFNVPEHVVVRLPDGIDPDLGAFFANAETALNVAHDTPLRLGETALVFGQGVVGLMVTRMLVLAGAGRVMAVEPLGPRRGISLEMGADESLAPDESLRDRVMAATGGRGADVAVEASGSEAALRTAVEAVAAEGTVVVASWYGTRPVSLPLGGNFHRGRVRLRSSQVGRINPDLAPRWDRDRRSQTVLELLPHLRLEKLLVRRVSFSQAPDAYRLVDEEPDAAVAVILTHQES